MRRSRSHASITRRGSAALHARNVHQILGLRLDQPVEFVVCWTPNGDLIGGTAMAMRIARAHDIFISNLWYAKEQMWWEEQIKP